MKIPEPVKQAAQGLIDMYGFNIDYLGTYEGADVYMYHFPDDVDTGFPFVYLYDNDNVEEITDFEALDIIRLFVKD